MANAKLDQNSRPTLTALSSSNDGTIVQLWADPTLHALLTTTAGGSGTVTSVSVVTNQGVSGSVATATTTPAITISLGALTGVTSFNGLVVTANTGAITTGSWAATAIPLTKGGTGADLSAVAKGGLISGTGAGTVGITAVGADGTVLSADAASAGGVKWIAAAGSGTVTTVSVATANGFAGSVANATTTPAITLTTSVTGVLKGNGTAISAATAGSDYAVGSIGLAGGQTIAGSTLTAENLTLRANAADLTTGAVIVSSSKEATSSTVGSVQLAGGLAVAKRVYALDMTVTNAITGSVTGNAGTITLANDVANATDYLVFANAATGANALKTATAISVNPSTAAITATTFIGALSGNATTASGVAVGGITGLGTGVATALAVNVGSAGAFVTFNGALGTPSSGTGTNITGITAAHVVAGTFGTGSYVMDTALSVGTTLSVTKSIATGFTTTATAAGTTTMDITSTEIQYWTGTSTQTVKLPTTSVLAGARYTITNTSTGLVTVQSSGANTICTLGLNQQATFNAIVATPTTAANWTYIKQNVSANINGKRLLTVTQSATPSMDTDNGDIVQITGIAQAITSMTTNLTGTPAAGDLLEIQFTDSGTARALTFGASFGASTVALPTTTVISTMLRVLFQYDTVWRCIAVA